MFLASPRPVKGTLALLCSCSVQKQTLRAASHSGNDIFLCLAPCWLLYAEGLPNKPTLCSVLLVCSVTGGGGSGVGGEVGGYCSEQSNGASQTWSPQRSCTWASPYCSPLQPEMHCLSSLHGICCPRPHHTHIPPELTGCLHASLTALSACLTDCLVCMSDCLTA